MRGLLTSMARRLGFTGDGAAVAAPDPLAADIDCSLARRRAAREAQAEAHERAQATLRAKKIARCPIMRDRDIIMGGRS